MEDFLQENRQLYLSQVASFKAPATEDAEIHRETDPDTIIAARVRPLLPTEIAEGEVVGVTVRNDTGNVDVHQLRPKFFSNRAPKLILDTSSFLLDRTYGPEQSSEYMYNDLVKPLVPWAWNGGISTLFAYGQTGSGKTYSVQSLQHLVATDLMNGSLEGDREIKLSICEMIGHKTFDLLNNRHPIKILEDSFGETQLVGVVEHRPKTATEFLSLLAQSTTLRQTEQTLKNDTSSRSHAVCRIRVCNPARPSEPDGLIFLVDLAGSEYASDVRFHSASRMKERREINISLSTLKDCIRGRALYNLGGEKKAHVPFRWSLLTKVLKHVFDVKSERACKTVVLACVKPNAGEAPAGKNTLRFAEVLRVRVPKMEPEFCHHEVPRTWSHEYLVEWIKKNVRVSPQFSYDIQWLTCGLKIVRNTSHLRHPPRSLRNRCPINQTLQSRICNSLS
jgi:kinesin family protein 2/24